MTPNVPSPAPLASMADVRRVLAVLRPYRHGLPRCVIQELAQEAITRTVATPGVRSPVSFARRTAVHLAIDCLRRQRPVRRFAHWPTEGETAMEPPLDTRHIAPLLARAPARYRDLLQRHYLDDEPLESLVADEAGGPRTLVGERRWTKARDVVYKRRTRALAWCRERLLTH